MQRQAHTQVSLAEDTQGEGRSDGGEASMSQG